MTRLLNVNTYHYRRGGSDVVYLEHAAMMVEAGLECGYFAMHHPRNEATPWSTHFVDELEFGHRYGRLEQIVMASKVVYSFEAQRKLRRLLDVFPADVAHLHCIYHHLSPAILPVLRERGVPVVMTAHDLKIACPNYKMLNGTGLCERCKDGSVLNVIRHRCVRDSLAASAVVALETLVHRQLDTWRRHLDVVVCPSRFFIEKFVEWGWPRERFEYVPNFVDTQGLRPLFDAGAYALYFGRLALDKGLATLIRAAHEVRMPLKLAGTGPDEAALKALAQSLRADVDFLGYTHGDRLHDAVRSARCVVLPSELYENASMMVLEAMALGKVVVGARIGGIPEMVDVEETGWLFESGSVPSLSEALRCVQAASDGRLRSMGQQARLRVETDFSRDRYRRSMLALYRRLGVKLPADRCVTEVAT